ncbi:DUF1800 domain-containing protein [Akkermansiaceae bacterium]|nr:DUF1800 domain-containing protein [Akkermansiaceae bacterium]
MKGEMSDAVTRRNFLLGSGGAALFSMVGCEQVEKMFSQGPKEGPVVPPSGEGIDLVSHVVNRLSFGPTPSEYARVKGLAKTEEEAAISYIEEQLDAEGIDDKRTIRAVRRFEAIHAPLGEMYEYKEEFLLEQMTQATLVRATQSKRQLYEVMVHFWTDHFNIDASKEECRWLKAADDREVIRKHALGNFPEMVKASALSPAMLWYLDGRQNRKRDDEEKPNENYARELLELHTLGVNGGYSQEDVMEVARCLSGWSARGKKRFYKGKVEFDSSAHDDGAKTVLGHEIAAGGGEKDLDAVLAIVCGHESTARYLAEKLCVRFIGDEPSEAAVSAVARAFSESKGDIKTTLRALFGIEAFLSGERGSKLKRPFEFIVSALRGSQAEVKSNLALIDYLVRMGHAPFQYPTPDGYPDVASPWSGTLLWRWHFAISLARNEIDEKIIVDEKELIKKCGGIDGLSASLLGRLPTAAESESITRSGESLALILASPGFQWR